jgi:hypothetical protein
MNDLIEAAIDITEDATSIAQELLERWYRVAKVNIQNCQYPDRAMVEIDQRYREYKNKIDKLRHQ